MSATALHLSNRSIVEVRMGSDAASRNAKIDAGLKQAADEGDVPGVVAMATEDRKSVV